MRVRGIHYDIGTEALDGSSTRPSLDLDQVRQELEDIAGGLHANAVRITGGNPELLGFSGQAAIELGLEAWLSPTLPNADAAGTLAAIEHAADIAERLRRGGGSAVLVLGCELSAFMTGILPGESQADRLALLTDLPRLIATVSAAGYDPQERFYAFLDGALRAARQRFDGPLTYAAGTWEQVDWSRFDLVGVDAYRDAGNRAGYAEVLRAQVEHGRPVVVTETGCATFRGAADLGSLAWTAVDRGATPRRLKDFIVRDEAEQASELGAVLDLVEASGIDGAFVYTYVAPSYPANDDPSRDLDAASYALVRSWSDGRTDRKAAYTAVAERYARSA